MSKFITTRLAGDRMLVTNGGKKQAILDTQQWDHIKSLTQTNEAQADFDKAVKDFFAPLTEAIDKIEEAKAPKIDETYVVVVGETVEGTPGKQARAYHLGHDAAVLRILESGDHSRLVWVGNDAIEIVAAD